MDIAPPTEGDHPNGARLGALDTIRRAIAALAEIPDDSIAALIGHLDRWLAQSPGEAVTFDAVLGLPCTWRDDLRRIQRDGRLVRLWRLHCPQQAGRKAARSVAATANRYETTSWPRDRRARRRPDGVNGAVYDVLTLGPIPGEETLRRLFLG